MNKKYSDITGDIFLFCGTVFAKYRDFSVLGV